MNAFRLASSLVVLATIAITGCQPTSSTNATDDHGHGDHGHHHETPTTYSAAVHQLEELNEQVHKAFEAGTPKQADGPMHDVFSIIDSLTMLSEKAGLDPDQQAEVKLASEELLTAYDHLHGPMHGGGDASEVAYDDVAEKIKSAFNTLASFDADHDPDHDHGAADHGTGDHGHDGKDGDGHEDVDHDHSDDEDEE